MSDKPRPIVDELNAPFWQACSPDTGEPRLLLQRCRDCGGLRCPPEKLCPACGSGDFTWQAASGRATLWSWTRIHKAYLPGFDPPYTACLVKLKEGPVIVSALTDETELTPDMPLRLAFRQGLPVFTPAVE